MIWYNPDLQRRLQEHYRLVVCVTEFISKRSSNSPSLFLRIESLEVGTSVGFFFFYMLFVLGDLCSSSWYLTSGPHWKMGFLDILPSHIAFCLNIPDQIPGSLEKLALPAWCAPAAYAGCVLSPSTHSQDTAAKCCLPSSCWTMRVLFPEVMTGPSSSGIYAAKSVRKFSLYMCN